MANIFLIGVGGALGALVRHGVNQVTIAQTGSHLWGTFIANVTGSFVLGLLLGLLSTHSIWPTETKMFVAVGFLGSYTTFSTLSVSTMTMLEKGDFAGAATNLGASVLFGVIAAGFGMIIGRSI